MNFSGDDLHIFDHVETVTLLLVPLGELTLADSFDTPQPSEHDLPALRGSQKETAQPTTDTDLATRSYWLSAAALASLPRTLRCGDLLREADGRSLVVAAIQPDTTGMVRVTVTMPGR